jgi:hypothetical protein
MMFSSATELALTLFRIAGVGRGEKRCRCRRARLGAGALDNLMSGVGIVVGAFLAPLL